MAQLLQFVAHHNHPFLDGYKFITYIQRDKQLPTLLSVFGLRFFFYSREHEPIHIHVANGDGVAKFEIQNGTVTMVENEGLKPKDLSLATSLVEENKSIFENEWIKYFGKAK